MIVTHDTIQTESLPVRETLLAEINEARRAIDEERVFLWAEVHRVWTDLSDAAYQEGLREDRDIDKALGCLAETLDRLEDLSEILAGRPSEYVPRQEPPDRDDW